MLWWALLHAFDLLTDLVLYSSSQLMEVLKGLTSRVAPFGIFWGLVAIRGDVIWLRKLLEPLLTFYWHVFVGKAELFLHLKHHSWLGKVFGTLGQEGLINRWNRAKLVWTAGRLHLDLLLRGGLAWRQVELESSLPGLTSHGWATS